VGLSKFQHLSVWLTFEIVSQADQPHISLIDKPGPPPCEPYATAKRSFSVKLTQNHAVYHQLPGEKHMGRGDEHRVFRGDTHARDLAGVLITSNDQITLAKSFNGDFAGGGQDLGARSEGRATPTISDIARIPLAHRVASPLQPSIPEYRVALSKVV